MEIWKPIPQYEGLYEVSNYGEIRSAVTQRIKNQFTKPNGYKTVQLWVGNKGRSEYVHRLVAFAFVPNPNNYPQVNHKNEVKSDNRAENLEWCTQKYNNNYGTKNDRAVKANRENGFYERRSELWKTNENPAIKNPKKYGDNSYARPVICDGKEFSSIKECAEYYGVPYGSMRLWITQPDRCADYFKEHNLHYKDVLPEP